MNNCDKCGKEVKLTYEQIWFDDYSKPLLCGGCSL